MVAALGLVEGEVGWAWGLKGWQGRAVGEGAARGRSSRDEWEEAWEEAGEGEGDEEERGEA